MAIILSSSSIASTTLEFGAGQDLSPTSSAVFGQLLHSSSIIITDTDGTTVHYRAMTGSGDGIMVTGSGEYRRYLHEGAFVGEFITGS